jgi:hypothetical protein
VDSHISDDTVIPAAPGPDDNPVSVLANAGATGTVTKLSGSYATFDGLEIDNPAAQ